MTAVRAPISAAGRRGRVTALILGLALAALITGAGLTVIDSAERRTVASIETDLVSDLNLTTSSVILRLRTLASLTNAAVGFISERSLQGDDGLHFGNPVIYNLAREYPNVRTMAIVDPSGRVVSDTRAKAPAIGMNVSDRRYFQVHQNAEVDGLYISEPIVSRIDQRWTWVLSRAVRDVSGHLLAVVVVSIDRRFFQDLFLNHETPYDHAEMLILNSGEILEAEGEAVSWVGRDAPGFLLPSAEDDVQVSHGVALPWSDAAHTVAAVKPAGWPVYVVSSLRGDVIDTAVASATRWLRIALVAVVVTVLAIAALLQLQVRTLARNEARERASAQRLEDAQLLARIGDFSWDLETGRVTWSHTLYTLLGYDPDEALDIDRVNREIHHPDDLQRITRWLEDGIARQVPRLETNNYRLRRKDGGVIHARVTARLDFEEGRPVTLFGTMQDVTEQAQAQAAVTDALKKAIFALSATLEARDPYTAGHEQRVAEIAVAIGRRLQLDPQRLEGLELAATIHDIGKIHIPAEILSKPTRLLEAEFKIIKEHPVVGAKLLGDIDFEWPIAEIVRQHHERLDGSGYPDGLAGEAILLEARIIGVADVVEAMAASRPYRPGLGLGPAADEIRAGAGTRYDPDVARVCLELIEAGEIKF